MNDNNEEELNSGIQKVHSDNHTSDFEAYNKHSVADILNKALKEKDETLEYIYSEFQKDKNKERRNVTREEIKSWFDGKSYPNLDQMYKLSYILPINPMELWQIKLHDEKSMQKTSKTAQTIGDMLTRGAGKNELLLMSILYSFIFVAFLFVALAIRGYFNAVNYNEEQSQYYVEGAIDEGIEKTVSNEVYDSYINAVESGSDAKDWNAVQNIRERYGNSSNIVNNTNTINTNN
jgi:hypothetical protein